MARRFTLQLIMDLATRIGANPSKLAGTRTNISFLGKGPNENPLFQRPLPGLENAKISNLGDRDTLIKATEDAVGWLKDGKLNSIQSEILGHNLSGINKILNPPVLPSASVTPIRSGITTLRSSDIGAGPRRYNELTGLNKPRLVKDGVFMSSRDRLPGTGPGDIAAALDQKTGMSRAIARNLLLKDTRLKLKPEELFMLKEGKGEPLDLMAKYYGESMHLYDDFLNSVNVEAARPDQFAAMILKNVKLIPQFAEGGLAGILQVPRSGYAKGGWSPGVGRDERGYQSSHPSYQGRDGGGGDGQGVTTKNVVKSPIIDTGRPDYNFNLGNESLSPSFAFKYSPAKFANLRARIYNQNLLESDDINVEGDLSGTIGPVDYSTQFTDQGFGNTNLNYGNFSANIDPNKNYNLSYQTNRDGVNTGARYDSDGNLMFTAGIKFNKGGLARILEV